MNVPAGKAAMSEGARLLLLGPFALQLPDVGELPVTSKKNRALLALVALAPGRKMTREKLCGYLWGDRADEQARASLRQSLASLRRELGDAEPKIFARQDDVIALHADTLAIDALDLASLASASATADLRHAANLWRGELMADIELDGPGFSDWLRSERQRLLDRAVAVHERLAALDSPDAADWARRLVALDPLREASHRLLMTALARYGDRAQAIRQFELCRDLLKRELGVEPSGATVGLMKEIAEERLAVEPVAGLKKELLPAKNLCSLAVLPFSSFSEERGQQHLADGMTEDLITDLSKVAGLSVIAAHSVLRFSGQTVEPRDAARVLAVRHIVQGSLRRIPDGLRINAQLVDTETGRVAWAERYDSTTDRITDIAEAIVQAVAAALTGAVAPQSERYRSASLEAFDLVMRGRKEFRHSDEAGAKAMPLFERAIALDPGYSEAYRWLALGQFLSWFAFGAAEQPIRRLSMENAVKAVTIDPGDSAAHAIHGVLLTYERQWEAADQAFARALTLNPFDPDAWSSLSDLRMFEGRTREAVECGLRALERNPRPFGSVFWLLGQAQFAHGDLQAAVTTLRREETYATASRRHLAAALALLGQKEQAVSEARLFMADNPHFTISTWLERQPFKDSAMRDRFATAYRLAGLPD